jgi:hypothetical protein
VKIEDDGTEEHTVSGTQTFSPGQVLPETYASDDDPDADLCLTFPTTLAIEQRADGTYYHFRRVYVPRGWAYVQYWKERFIDDDIKKLGAKPPQELTQEERLQIVEAFAIVEAFKQIEFAKAASEECAPDLPPVDWLRARQALVDVYEGETDQNSFDDMLELCRQAPEARRGECFDTQAERILANGYAALVQSLQQDADFRLSELEEFDRAYERAQSYYENTDELGAHHFEIEVEMPGKVIAHNGDDLDEVPGKSTVEWMFDGKAFRDRPYELLAISRVVDEAESEAEDTADDDDR